MKEKKTMSEQAREEPNAKNSAVSMENSMISAANGEPPAENSVMAANCGIPAGNSAEPVTSGGIPAESSGVSEESGAVSAESGEETLRKNKVRRAGKSAAREIAYLALSVALVTVCAWISLPVGEVPFTLQTFAVALVGGLLGWKRGFAAIAVYVLMGLIGIPVFAGFKAGAAALAGTTGGYIIGFVFAGLISGLWQLIPVRSAAAKTGLAFAAMVIGLAVCYFFGTVWFILLYNRGTADPIGVSSALAWCVIPYLLPDAIKLAIAAMLCVRLRPFVKIDTRYRAVRENEGSEQEDCPQK